MAGEESNNPTPAPAPAEDPAAKLARLESENKRLREESAERRVAAKRAEEERAVAQRRLQELEPYQQSVAQEVEALKGQLGDRARLVEGLSDTHALRILRELKGLAAGPGPARPTTQGHPSPTRTTVDLNAMNPAERQQYLQTLPHEELVRLVGGGRRISPLADTPKRGQS